MSARVLGPGRTVVAEWTDKGGPRGVRALDSPPVSVVRDLHMCIIVCPRPEVRSCPFRVCPLSQERAMSVAVLPRLCWRSASSSLCAAGRGRTAWTAWTMSDVATWTLDERLEQWLPCPLFLLLLLHLLLSPSQCPAAER